MSTRIMNGFKRSTINGSNQNQDNILPNSERKTTSVTDYTYIIQTSMERRAKYKNKYRHS